MTDERLRDLLQDRVSDLDPDEFGDLGGPAWARARRTRHRRAAVVGGGAVAAVLAVTAVAVLPGDGRDPAPPVQSPTPGVTPMPPRQAEASGDYRGGPTWWAPSENEEPALPVLAGTPLPEEIDLAPGAPPHEPGVRAVAMFVIGDDDAVTGRVVVVGTDGSSYSLDVGRLDRVTDEAGNAYSPLAEGSLAPDGRRAFFVQRSSLEVYDLETGAWSTIETLDWLAENTRWISDTEIFVPDELGTDSDSGVVHDVATGSADAATPPAPVVVGQSAKDTGYGPLRVGPDGAVAQAQFLAEPVKPPEGGAISGVDAVAARTSEGVALLVLPYDEGGRWKGCCPVIGWLDGETVLFQSRSNASRILAWRAGSPQLWRVSEVSGWEPGAEFHLGTFADPSRD